MDDRLLIERELMRYTAAGWQIVSQTDTAFQVMLPHVVDSGVVAFLVIGPLALGVFVSLGSAAFGAILFWIAVIVALLLALNHLSTRPKLLYITAEQLRTPATIEHNARGAAVCSRCNTLVQPKATTCPGCRVTFA